MLLVLLKEYLPTVKDFNSGRSIQQINTHTILSIVTLSDS